LQQTLAQEQEKMLGLIYIEPAIKAGGDRFILLASTIGPVDAGIVAALENGFEKETGIRVRHVGAGTGETLKIAQKGSIDLVLVHAKKLEEQFVADGYGTERIPLMYNDFVILGPADDPAGIKDSAKAAAALAKIAAKKSLFVSRGDNSGTNMAEKELWEQATIKPEGDWYKIYEKGADGNGPTLEFASQLKAYTVMDRATWLGLKDKIQLAVLVEGDEALMNYMSLIPVSQQKFPRVNAKDTKQFVNWLTDPEKGQAIIRDFGKDKYGQALFFPNSKKWIENKAQ
jgi:tungstate transport system substrate-binding protein